MLLLLPAPVALLDCFTRSHVLSFDFIAYFLQFVKYFFYNSHGAKVLSAPALSYSKKICIENFYMFKMQLKQIELAASTYRIFEGQTL